MQLGLFDQPYLYFTSWAQRICAGEYGKDPAEIDRLLIITIQNALKYPTSTCLDDKAIRVVLKSCAIEGERAENIVIGSKNAPVGNNFFS